MQSHQKAESNRLLVLAVWVISSVLWSALLFNQELTKGIYRWTLFLIPDQAIATWIDGPVTFGGFVDRLAVIGVAAGIAAVALIAGRFVLVGSVVWRRLTWIEALSLATVLGLTIHSTVICSLGWLGLIKHPFYILLDIAVTVGLGFVVGKVLAIFAHGGPREQSAASEPKKTNWLPHILLFLFAVFILSKAILPPAEYDVREYHLQAPKQWWLEGQISFLPNNIYANMPLAAESHSLAAMMAWSAIGANANTEAWWWGALSGKVLIATYAILCAFLLGGCSRLLATFLGFENELAVHIGHWCRVFVVACPAIIEGSALGLNETAIACNFSAVLIAIACGLALSETGYVGHRAQVTGIVALASGGAIAIKYPALILIVPVAIFLLLAYCISIVQSKSDRLYRRIVHWPSLLIAFVMVGIGGGIWYFKNWVLAGNPVYPLAGGYFGGETLTPEKIAQWNAAHAVPENNFDALGKAIGDLLWRWRLQGWVLVPMVLTGLTAMLSVGGKSRRTASILLISGIYAIGVWWFLSHRVDRFLIPMLPIAFLFAGIAWGAVARFWDQRAATIGSTVLLFFNLVYVCGPLLGDARIFVSLDYLRIDDLSASTVTRLPDHISWVNANLNRSDRLLVIGDAAVFDYEMPIGYSTTFDRSPLIDLVEDEPSRWAESFLDSEFDYVLVHWGEIERLSSTYGFDQRIKPALFSTLIAREIVKRVEIIDRQGSWELFKIENEKNSELQLKQVN